MVGDRAINGQISVTIHMNLYIGKTHPLKKEYTNSIRRKMTGNVWVYGRKEQKCEG